MSKELQPSIHHPHDRFFKCLLEEQQIAQDLLERYLPSNTLRHLDLQCLDRMPNEGFLTHQIQVDVVWRSRIKSTGEYIYLLFEHQSTHDSKMARRLRHYMWMLSDRFLNGEEDEYPIPVLSIVFYHGSQTQVPSFIYLRGNTKTPIVAPGVFGLASKVPVVNYQQLTWQQIPTHLPASMLECCLKARLDPRWEVLQVAMRHLQLRGNFAQKTIREIHLYLLHHIQVHQSQLEVFYQIIQLPHFTPVGDMHMATLAEWIANTTPEKLQQQWLQEGLEKGLEKGLERGMEQGLEKGLEKGMEKGQSQLIRRMLENGMDLENIAMVTGFTTDEIQQRLSHNK